MGTYKHRVSSAIGSNLIIKMGDKMFDIAKRLEICKANYEDELKQSNPSKVYLDDLQSSIDDFERLLQNCNDGYKIIKNS